MGAYQNNPRVASKKGGSRGSVRNADRLKAFAKGDSTSHADWGTCNTELLQAVVVGITAVGGAVTFGLSRDLGAHSLTLLLDDNRKTFWYNGDADLTQELSEVVATLETL